jgi:hypothetical protein
MPNPRRLRGMANKNLLKILNPSFSYFSTGHARKGMGRKPRLTRGFVLLWPAGRQKMTNSKYSKLEQKIWWRLIKVIYLFVKYHSY